MDEARIAEIRQWAERSAAPVPASLVDYLIVHGHSAEESKAAFAEYSSTGYVAIGGSSWGDSCQTPNASEED